MASVDSLVVHERTDDKYYNDVLVIANVKNLGMDSIVEWRDLYVTTPGAREPIKAERLSIPDSVPIQVTPSTYVNLSGKDALYKKTLDRPLAKGAFMRGLLMFGVKGLSRHNLTQPGTKYEITFADIQGTVYSMTYYWGIVKPGINSYLPGLEMDFSPMPRMPTRDHP